MPRTTPKTVSKWQLGLIGAVLVAALGLGVVRAVTDRSPAVPTSDVPAVTYDEVNGNSAPATPATDQPTSDTDGDTPVSSPATDTPTTEPTPSTDPTPTPTEEPSEEVAAEMNLAVPFTSQAPGGVWDAFHEDACEEASIIMVLDYLNGITRTTIPVEEADERMHAIVDYEESIGYGLSVSAAQMKVVINALFPEFTVTIDDNPTADDLRGYIADGLPVIIPAAGQMLGNPNFTGAGPLYHMLVLRGYDETGFITNDPGTRNGRNYHYSASVFMNAIHDWNNGDPENGTPRVIVLHP